MTLLQTKVVKYVVVYRLPYMVVLSGLLRSMAIGCTSRISGKIEMSCANCQVFTNPQPQPMGSVLSGAVIYAASYLFTILTIDPLPPLSQCLLLP